MKRYQMSALVMGALLLSCTFFSACGKVYTGDAPLAPQNVPLGLSHESGVYSNAFSLSVSKLEPTNQIYYTLDCSLPTTHSTRYTQPILIDDVSAESDYPLTSDIADWYSQIGSPRGAYTFSNSDACTVVNLLEVDARGKEVARKTKTYFVREGGKAAFTLPVVSLSLYDTLAYDFYTDVEGERKVRAEMEYFDFARGEHFARNTQIKVGGNWTKYFPYHTMNVNFNKDENGEKNEPVTTKIFGERTARDGSELTDFRRFRLHCGGNAQNITWFGDAFVQTLAAEYTPSDGKKVAAATTGYRPCEVYLNGEYWGLYAIREHYSDVYFEQNYGVDKDDVILIDRAQNIAADDPAYADESVFHTKYRFEVAEDSEDGQGMQLATQLFDACYRVAQLGIDGAASYRSELQELEALIDVEGLTDLILINAFAGNWDFMNNNIKLWRTATVDESNPYADGKWRVCLHDLDFSFEFYWGDNGLYGANGHLLRDPNVYDNFFAPGDLVYRESAPYLYRPSVNYFDFYLGNAYLEYNEVGRLSLEEAALFRAFVYDEAFREQFAARAKAIAALYGGEEASALFHDMTSEVDTAMKKHVLRWNRTQLGDEFDYTIWKNKLNTAERAFTGRVTCGGIYPNRDYFDRQIEAAFYRLEHPNKYTTYH